jgi:two-component system, NarL family, invasion response regulator UvrY
LIKVLVVDDHDIVRTGIKRMLADVKGIKVIAEAENGEEAISLTKETRPDVVLMDIKMPRMDGLKATRTLLQFDPDIKVLVITSLEDDLISARLLRAGASGYLTKGASMEEMIRAIRAVHVGQRYMSPTIARQLAFKHVTDSEKSPFEVLSERELEVLMLLINGSKVQEISKKLDLSSKTISTFRSRMLKKLGVKNDVELTLMAVRHGLIDYVVKDEK